MHCQKGDKRSSDLRAPNLLVIRHTDLISGRTVVTGILQPCLQLLFRLSRSYNFFDVSHDVDTKVTRGVSSVKRNRFQVLSVNNGTGIKSLAKRIRSLWDKETAVSVWSQIMWWNANKNSPHDASHRFHPPHKENTVNKQKREGDQPHIFYKWLGKTLQKVIFVLMTGDCMDIQRLTTSRGDAGSSSKHHLVRLAFTSETSFVSRSRRTNPTTSRHELQTSGVGAVGLCCLTGWMARQAPTASE